MKTQVKLLRLLQECKYYPLGADVPKSSNARTVVATNREIQFLRDSESFRNDLYFRLQSHHIHLPPLRERTGDIPLLVAHFLESAAERLDQEIPTPAPELLTLLETYQFPGNVRELEGMVLDAVSQHKGGVLSIESFRNKIGEESLVSHEATETAEATFVDGLAALHRLPPLKAIERFAIAEALRRARGNQTIAAGLLGMSRQALHNRLNRERTLSDDV